jgi:hypothetical protein
MDLQLDAALVDYRRSESRDGSDGDADNKGGEFHGCSLIVPKEKVEDALKLDANSWTFSKRIIELEKPAFDVTHHLASCVFFYHFFVAEDDILTHYVHSGAPRRAEWFLVGSPP